MPEAAVRDFVEAINKTFPTAGLALDDIRHVHWGFLPLQEPVRRGQDRRLLRDNQVIDHEVEDGIAGLLSVVGVKLTTARHAAEKAVDLAGRKLGKGNRRPAIADGRVFGGDFGHLDEFVLQARQKSGDELSADTMERLARTYGTSLDALLALAGHEPTWRRPFSGYAPVIGVEVIYAVREEMAQTLEDVVRRRTVLGSTGLPDESSLDYCARLVAAELGWDDGRRRQEVENVRRSYGRLMPWLAGPGTHQ
jgi:glycerol-3-phosphate dehydrogenase